MTRVLTQRELNRTLLARQLLLRRERMPVARVLSRVGGLQAQDVPAPVLGLFARRDGFEVGELQRALKRRTVVRATLMRGTVHLLAARDYLALEPALTPMIREQYRSYLRDRAPVRDLDGAVARALELAREPVPATALRDALGEDAWWRVRRHERFVYAPVDGERWCFGRRAFFVSAESWLGRSTVTEEAALAQLIRRGLAATGPSTVADLAAWSGMSVARVREGVERLRLSRFADEQGRELVDLPRALRVPGDARAPVRLLPAFDNTILSHVDRTRVLPDEYRRVVIRGGLVDSVVLVDGFVAGRWRIERARGRATLVLERFAPLPRKETAELREEARRMLAFAEPDVTGKIKLA